MMKSATCLHLKSPLRKRGVERFVMKFTNYFPDRKFHMVLTWKTRIKKKRLKKYEKTFFYFFYFRVIPVRDQFLWEKVVLLRNQPSFRKIMEIHQYLAANCSLRRNKCLHISFTIPLLMSAEFLVDKFGISHSYKNVGFYYCLKQLITIAWLSVFELFCYFFYQKKTLC